MVDGLGARDVQVLVEVLLVVAVPLRSLVVEVSLLLIEVLGVVDGDEDRAVEVMTDAEFVDADVEIVAVNSGEVLSGVALENVESDEEETPLVNNDVMVALGILETMLDDSTLDRKEALLGDVEPVGKIEVLNILVVLVGTTELGAPTLEVVSVLKMSETVLELDGFSAVLSCEVIPTSMEL